MNTQLLSRIHRYLRSEMDADEAHQFELDMMDDDELFHCYEQEYALQQGLRSTAVVSNTKPIGIFGLSWERLAALTLVLVLGVGVILQQQRIGLLNGKLASQLAPSNSIHVVTIQHQRSFDAASSQHQVDINADSEYTLIEVDVSAFDEQTFKADIQGNSGSTRWHQLTPDERGYITLLIPNNRSAESPSSINILNSSEQALYNIKLQE